MAKKLLRHAIICLLSIAGSASVATAQEPQWYLGNDRIDFTGPTPTTTSLSLGTPFLLSVNEAYDLVTNAPLFQVEDGDISGLSTVLMGLDGGEVAVVPVPGTCNVWYVIGTNSNPSTKTIDLRYAVVSTRTSTPTLVGGMVTVATVGLVGSGMSSSSGCSPRAGIAVTKLNTTTNKRFLFTVGPVDVPGTYDWGSTFEISGSGITKIAGYGMSSPFSSSCPSSFSRGYAPGELEVYEKPNGSMVLAWTDLISPCNLCGPTPDNIFAMNISSTGAPGSYVYSGNVSGATGIEFYDNGSRLLISATDGIHYADLSTPTIVSTSLSGSLDYAGSMIERAADGNYYAIGHHSTTSHDLRAIDVSAPSTPTMSAFNIVTGFNVRLPDQVDDESPYGAGSPLGSNLTANDDNLDIGVEPNANSASFKTSPDLWNIRPYALNDLVHQNPNIFYSENTAVADRCNILRLRVTNNGCAMSSTSYARLYTSIRGNATNNWPSQWDGTATLNGEVVGSEITTAYPGVLSTGSNATATSYVPGNGFEIPPLNRGEDFIINAQWTPTPPHFYGIFSAPNAQISFLGRVLENGAGTIPNESTGVAALTNVINSNSIVMRDANLSAPGKLMAKDNAADNGTEPYNTTSDVWHSDDIWNRAYDDGVNTSPEDADYYSSVTYPGPYPDLCSNTGVRANALRMRIKNHGTETSAPTHVKMYWTVGATVGEVWPAAWDGSLLIPNSTQPMGQELKCAYQGTLLPSGANGANNEATRSYETVGTNELGFPVPSLDPGEEYIVSARWQPLNPTSTGRDVTDNPTGPTIADFFNHNTNPEICYLGRIVDPYYDPMHLEYNPSTTGFFSFSWNVRYNNNWVTRNSSLISLKPPSFKNGTGSFFMGNLLPTSTAYNLDLAQSIYSSSIPFGDVARCVVTLDGQLWSKWIAGGADATGLTILDSTQHTLSVTNMAAARLTNITLDPNEYRCVGLFFELDSTATDAAYYNVVATQALSSAPDSSFVNNACHFEVYVNDTLTRDTVTPFSGYRMARTPLVKSLISAYPNPAGDMLTIDLNMAKQGAVTIQIADLTGRVIRTIKSNELFTSGSYKLQVSTAELPAGMYLINCLAGGDRQIEKITIAH